jgi:hypothetical protein
VGQQATSRQDGGHHEQQACHPFHRCPLGRCPSDESAILEPASPGPLEHYRSLDPREADKADFSLQTVGVGEASVGASASVEMHLVAPGPAYWGHSGAREPLVITVKPQSGAYESLPGPDQGGDAALRSSTACDSSAAKYSHRSS